MKTQTINKVPWDDIVYNSKYYKKSYARATKYKIKLIKTKEKK
jgi:hypothetical protein